ALNGAYGALAGWSVLRLAVGLSLFSAGPAWGALLWRSLRAAPMERDAVDPAPAQVRDWLERAPHWAAPFAVTAGVFAVGLARVSAEPRVEDGAARLLALVLLTPPLDGPGALLALLSGAVRALPLGTLAWRLNAAPVVPVAIAAFGAGVCVVRFWPAARRRALAHGAGALGTAGVALLAGAALGVWNPAPEREAYRSLTVLNLEMLDRDALLCVQPRNSGLWAYALQIEGVRADVHLRHGSADECAALAAQEFSRRPVYVDALPGGMQRSELVYFPARGVWRAVSKRASFADGAVIKGPDERIFLIERGARRWIPSLDTFTALGLRWEHVQLASFDELAALPQGPPLG
ncbi:MAG TPA: hypothetical protein VFN74_06675, partial [Chloroflexota bacterium]|nr:hypothetical protein [Chloroflexota bacterium]